MGCCESKPIDENGNPLEERVPFQFQMLAEHSGGINCLSMSEDGSVLATGGEDRTVRVFNSNSLPCECMSILEGHDAYISCVAVEETYILTGSKDATLRKWEVGTGMCMFVSRGHTALINRIVCSGDFIFTSSYDKTARAWDWHSGDPMFLMKGHEKGVYSLIYIPGEVDNELSSLQVPHLLITSSTDGTAKLWNVVASRCLVTYEGHSDAITCITTNPGGTTLFTGSTDGTIRSFRTLTGEQLAMFQGHEAGVITICFTNSMLFSGSSDHTVRGWIADTGECVRNYKGHRHTVNSVRVYNGLMVTTCGDGVVRVFCARSAKLIRQFEGHSLTVNSAKLIGNRLYTSSYDGTLRIWDMRGCRDQLDLSVDPVEEAEKRRSKSKGKNKKNKVQDISMTDDKMPVMGTDPNEVDSGLNTARTSMSFSLSRSTTDGISERA